MPARPSHPEAPRRRVALYAPNAGGWPGYEPRVWPGSGARRRSVALVAVMRDEAASIPGWVRDVTRQTRRPDQLLVVDDGSADGSAELLERLVAGAPFPVTVLRQGQVGIAAGRNRAIALAQEEVIAVTDLGLGLACDWLERLVEPFEADAGTQVVAGFYRAIGRDGKLVRRRLWPTPERVDPATFLPASRSIAFLRLAWAQVGGYPEWLTRSGEDTWFAQRLREATPNWAFAPFAVVEWHAPDTPLAYWRKAAYWASGDGESGLGAGSYRRSAAVTVAAATAALAVVVLGRRRPPAGALAALVGLAGAGVLGRRIGLGLGGVVVEGLAQPARLAGWLQGLARRRAAQARR